MLDYQMVMVVREVGQECVQDVPAADGVALDSALPGFVQSSRQTMRAFVGAVVEQSVNLILTQRYQNRHRSVEGRT